MLKSTYTNVLVRAVYEEKSGTIVIPDTVKKSSGNFSGEVVAVGPEYPWDLSPGDRIIYERNEGTPVTINDIEYVSLKEERVLAKEII